MRTVGNALIVALWLVMAGVTCVGRAGPVATGPEPAAQSSPSDLHWQFAYDDAGRITRTVDPGGKETKVRYELDGKGRVQQMVTELSDSSTVTLRFDSFGRRVSMTDGAGTVRYEYDDVGRLAAVRRDGAPAVCYTYDTLDRVKTLKVGDVYRVEYTYDFLGRLEKMDTPAGVVSYNYQTGQGQVVRTLPNGVKTFWKCQPNGELEEITHGLFMKPDDNRYTVLAQYTYAHGPDGRIAAIRERSGQGEFTRRYTYDTMGRLTGAARPGNREYRCEYDQVGNRTRTTSTGRAEQVCTYDWAGRLTTADGKPVGYDASGNLTEVVLGGVTHRYGYRPDGYLAEARVGDESVQYRYDGSGRLVVRKTAAGETRFIPDPISPYWKPLVVEEPDGARTLVVWDGCVPLALVRNGKTEWLLHDHLGSVRLVTDANGRVVRSPEYDPFGTPEGATESAAPSPGFAGLFWDAQAAAYLTMARTHMPELARFLQPDPVKPVPNDRNTTHSVFTYCGGDPVNLVDLDGQEPVSVRQTQSRWNSFWHDTGEWWSAFGHELFSSSRPGPPLLSGNERDSVIQQVVDNAMYTAHGDVVGADTVLRGWRYSARNNRDVYIREHPNAPVPTENEWQAAENYMYARKYVETGGGHGMFKGMLDTQAGERAAESMANWQIPMWQYAHFWGPRLHLDPNWILRLPVLFKPGGFSKLWSGEREPWQPQTEKTIDWQYRGCADGLLHSQSGPRSTSTDSQKLGTSRAYRKPTNGPRDEKFWFGGDSPPPPPGGGGWGGPGGGGWGGGQDGWGGGLAPSSVGGVYLGGAGRSLAMVGLLDGVTLDRNGNLVLVGKTGDQVKLQALRLDDVVTVFRSVYLDGEGPTVTIDPDPRDPERLPMMIKHSKATEGTYVGWVLYQGDRLMKGYTQGVDNITERAVDSRVPGYPETLDTIYFGGQDPAKLQKEGHWERFWIVPAQVSRLGAPRNELTLFDVPLKVNTQTMKWENGALVDDSSGASSPGALAFTKWFTANYDLIAGERFLTPPPESGISEPVPVFTELRRIALITAIAEKLRDQGVPMPFWMRDYEVRPVPFEKTTPGREVSRSNQNVVARVFGGVDLSVDDKNLKQLAKGSDLSALPQDDRDRVAKKLDVVDFLEESVRDTAPAAKPLTPWILAHQTGTYQAVAVPGAETRALASCRLDEADLTVPVEGGYAVELVRSYNSFFDPTGPLGKGWALDLPHLEEVKMPVRRDAGHVEYEIAYDLVTPLNSTYARLGRVEKVPELNGSSLQVPDKACEFFGLADAKPEFLSGPTHELIRKDGGSWHFSKERGDLVTTEQGGFRTVYERGDRGQLTRIVGLLGRQPAGSIELHYDAKGRLDSATAKKSGHESTIRYEYDDAGRLAGVVSSSGRLGYRYDGSWVKAVTFQAGTSGDKQAEEAVVRRFEYDAQGQLLAELDAAGARTEYRVTSDLRGNQIEAVSPGAGSQNDSVRYDAAYRPVEARYADGTLVTWEHPEGGDVVAEVTNPDGGKIRLTESADHRRRTLGLADNSKITGEYDTAGRLTSLAENGRVLLRQEWSGDGRLLTAGNETCAEHVEYDADGLMSRVLFAPPQEHGHFSHWQEMKLDSAGRPREISDYTGLQVLVDYDESGEPKAMACKREGKNYGFQITRDASGRIQEVESSWGKQHYTYDASGSLEKMNIEKQGRSASVQYQSGLLRRYTQFDGGEMRVDYYEEPARQGFPREIRTSNDLRLTYDYDPQSRLSKVEVGSTYRMEFAYDVQGRLCSLRQSPVTR